MNVRKPRRHTATHPQLGQAMKLGSIRLGNRGSVAAEFVVVMALFVVVLLVTLTALDRIRAYHDRSAQAMELPL